MAKSPLKIRVECPHCGFKQMEYAAAKNTLCRQCGRHFIVAAAERVERADQQLYRAKSQGRNRACLEQPTVSLVSAAEKGLLFGTSTFAELE